MGYGALVVVAGDLPAAMDGLARVSSKANSTMPSTLDPSVKLTVFTPDAPARRHALGFLDEHRSTMTLACTGAELNVDSLPSWKALTIDAPTRVVKNEFIESTRHGSANPC
ncbi:MAG TPA: hypothetical protein VIC81_05735 [Acidimicrobiales bacterium]